MTHIARASWLGIVAASSPPGHWPIALAVLFVGALIYVGLRQRYLVFWMCGWAFFLISRQAFTAATQGLGGAVSLTAGNVSFVFAAILFAISALEYTDSRQYLVWIYVLSPLGFAAAVIRGFWMPSSAPFALCFQAIYYAILLLAAARLVLFAFGRRELGPWIFALALLLLRPGGVSGNGAAINTHEIAADIALRLGIVLLLLDESRARARRLEVMNAITTAAVGARDYSSMMLTAMNELRSLYGAKFAWFQLVQGEDLLLELQVGLPDWFVAGHSRIPIGENASILLYEKSDAIAFRTRSFDPNLRHDMERAGIQYLIMTPVAGKKAVVGLLGFGFTGRRAFTAEQLRFLSTIANQLGIARENLRLFERVSNSQRQWLTTIDSIDDYILVHDAEPRVLRLNKALAHRLGRPVLDLTSQLLASVLPNADAGCPYCRLAKQTDGEVPDPCFGGYSWVSTSSYVEEQGARLGTVHIICDRTQRRVVEERYRLLFESVHEGVFVSTPQGQLIDCNPAFVSMLGYDSRAEMLAINIADDLFLGPDQRHNYVEDMNKQGYLRSYQLSLRRKDGRVVTLMENSFATRDAQGKIERYQGFLLDITEQKRAEDKMRRRNRELGALNAMATIATRTFDLDEILRNTLHWATELFGQHCDLLLFDVESGHVIRCESSRENRQATREDLRFLMDGELSEFMARAESEIITELDIPRLPEPARSWFEAHGYESFVLVAMHSQRKTMGILLISSPSRDQFTETDRNLAIAIGRQLGNSVEKVLLYEETARAYDNLRNAQEKLLQSEKMSAVGQLISGVAHELNNPLTAILGYAQLLETEPIGERAQDFVRKLYRQAQRTHRVVQNLLSFSRQRKPIQSQVDLRRVLEDTLSLREFDLKLNCIIVERDYDPSTPFVTGDAHQLEQVFLNIINNAVDAIMDSGQGGSLKVRIYTADGKACVQFHDSGPGLKDATKIFDPFYTTKKLGKGTGLGLSICYGIVKEHGGDITAFNHELGGAVFQLKLPIIASPKVRD